MKIYHKKNFAEGLFFTLLGAAFIVLFLVRGNIEPKSVVFCAVSYTHLTLPTKRIV